MPKIDKRASYLENSNHKNLRVHITESKFYLQVSSLGIVMSTCRIGLVIAQISNTPSVHP